MQTKMYLNWLLVLFNIIVGGIQGNGPIVKFQSILPMEFFLLIPTSCTQVDALVLP